MKRTILITILFVNNFLFAQEKYDTISFYDISLNNREIYTYFKFLKNKIDDKKNKTKVYPSEDIKIPFIKLNPENIVYNVISNNLGYYYTEKKPEYIYVTYIKPNQNLILKIKNNFTLNNDFDVNLFDEKFPYSFDSYKKEANNTFKLIVKKDKYYGLVELVFENDKFKSFFLIDVSKTISY